MTGDSVKNKFFTGLALQDVANIVPAQCGYNPHESLQAMEGHGYLDGKGTGYCTGFWRTV